MILIAHSEELFRRPWTYVLRQHGFDADHVSTGEEAMTTMLREPPELLLLNGTLEDMDGIDLLQLVRAKPPLARLPVCFTSTNCMREEEARPWGIQAFLSNPFLPEELLEVVGRYCRSSHASV